ncbi:septum site-determining protein Ssd [Streptomyces meridianus]|uniref:Septum formation initiator n=1 Tax=Streptomyces meridianus TaxID=2938945 RepID=A0ABT0X583_9ACTN|nr:septum site-determining protein Ssd [Streptomyces meridianus]MCM2577705.1 septum formation initiator [Streptomyces meridianus]
MTGVITSDHVPEQARQPGPLIITEDDVLLDDLLRLSAAAGTEPEVAYGAPGRASWDGAPLVLVGDDVAARLQGALRRRRGVLLVGRDLDDHGIWQRAVGMGADNVLFLPDAETWLVDRIADVAEGVGRQALTVGVIGGTGGAGASTLACALALAAARSGERTMLIDADPLGGGLDVLLGGESAAGLRWPAFADSRGRVGGGALEESLPELHEMRLLSWDRGDVTSIPPEAMRSVLAAARRRGGVVVVDLPRRNDATVTEALLQLDVGLLVVPGELRAVAAAQRVASTLALVLRDLRAVVRGPCTAGLRDTEIARLMGLPLAGALPSDAALTGRPVGNTPPGGSERGPLARFCAEFWERTLSRGEGVAS